MIDLKYLFNGMSINHKNNLVVSFEGVKRLLDLDFDIVDDNVNKVERNSHRKYFLLKLNITNYNVLNVGRMFYFEPIKDQIRKYEEIRKVATGQRDDYTTRFLVDYQYFRDYYQLSL